MGYLFSLSLFLFLEITMDVDRLSDLEKERKIQTHNDTNFTSKEHL